MSSCLLITSLLISIALSETLATCRDVYESGNALMDTVSFHHIVTGDHEVREVLCAFISINDTASFIGNLFESFSLSDGSDLNVSNVSIQSMFDDFPVHDISLNTLHSYRWSKPQIVDIHQHGTTYLLITCNFDISMTQDYVFTQFFSEFLWDSVVEPPNNCFHVESVNIRGHECADQTVNFWSLSEEMHFHINSDQCFCECCPWNNGSILNEDNFGFYSNINPNFSCSADEDSTTNYWIGEVIHHQTCEDIYIASNQSFTNQSTFVTLSDDGRSTEIMCSFTPLENTGTLIATLFESFSLLNGAIFSDLQFESFYDDHPMIVNETSINIAEYRWSKVRLIQYFDVYDNPKLLITCNLNTSLLTDYVLMDFYHDFLWNDHIDHVCYKVDSADIRGHACTGDTLPITSISQSQHFHISSDSCECNCCGWNNGSVVSEDNFGFYANVNREFSCNAETNSSTNYWISTILPRHSISTTPFYTTTTQPVTTSFPTSAPTTKHPTKFPTTHPTHRPTRNPTANPTNSSDAGAGSIPGIQTTEVTETEPLAKTREEQVLVFVMLALIVLVILTFGWLLSKCRNHNKGAVFSRSSMDNSRKSRGQELAHSSSEDQILTDVMSDEYRDTDPRRKALSTSHDTHKKASYDMLKIIEETEEVSFSSYSGKFKGEEAAILCNPSSPPRENSDKRRLL
eukprot:71507_1